MQKAFYDRLSRPFEKDERKRKRLTTTNSVITKAFYIAYPVLLIILAFTRDGRFLRVLLVPLISFVIVTVFRRACNARRPYEVWEAPPLIQKDTKRNSFPSRHVFSVFMIAMATAYICPPAAIIMMAAGVFLAAARVLIRVHFVRDVVAGALIGVGLGLLGFWAL
ncbi:MAG: phosphatase PAP2 family protein [Lachnospiraceae bacterium]|nr:phosphatase PAP2 family protein [Lachnospiraceae bacterium]